MRSPSSLIILAFAAACSPLRYPGGQPDASAGDASTDAGLIEEDAGFDAGVETRRLTLFKVGDGEGSFEVEGEQLECTASECGGRFPAGAQLTVVATPGAQSRFGGWSIAACDGAIPRCTLTLENDTTIGIVFEPIPTYDLVITTSGDGDGTVTGPDIDCPGDCTASFIQGTEVALRATAINASMFGGWGGDCSGTDAICMLVLDRGRNVVASFDRDQVSLTVNLAGDGGGRVIADIGALDCPGDCAESYMLNTQVTLNAAADTNNTFTGWSGSCTGTAPCVVTMSMATSVTATFELDRATLVVALVGSGQGNVSADVGMINCPGICNDDLVVGTAVQLTAMPFSGSSFLGWTGACGGASACDVTMDAPRSVTAEFAALRTLTVVNVGSGGGRVTSTPAGIDCGTQCTTEAPEGTTVVLSAAPNTDSYFVGWTGACQGTSPTCMMTVSTDASVAARYRLRAVQVSAGLQHVCAVFADGSVRCWGNGSLGRLGYGDVASIGDDPTDDLSTMQVQVGGPVAEVVAGTDHTCARLTNGDVRCWGDARDGQLGYGSTTLIGDSESPSAAGPVSLGAAATQLSASAYKTCASLSGGAVRCWGNNFSGELGLGTFGVTTHVGDNEVPTAVAAVSLGGTPQQLSCGGISCCVLLSTGVRCWGENGAGQLGLGNTDRIGDNELPSTAPLASLGATPTAIFGGSQAGHHCGIFPPSSGYRCWGRGLEGQLGPTISSNVGDNELPSTVAVMGSSYAEICGGDSHSCARTNSGQVFCWGDNTYGQAEPVLGSSGNVGGTAVDIACGSGFNCAALSTGGVRCWGRGANGRLGYGSTANGSVSGAGDVPL